MIKKLINATHTQTHIHTYNFLIKEINYNSNIKISTLLNLTLFIYDN